MTNNKEKTAVEGLIEQFWNNEGMLTSKKLEKALEIEKDQMEAAIIKHCAEQSTSEASKYAEGYKEGYKRALDYMTDTIKNKIEVNIDGSNIFTTTGTTNTTLLCTQFVAQNRITTSLPNCIKCGKPQYQHPIITNTP